MIEVYPNLFVGNQDDYENNVKYKANWAVVHACKDPYHRAALGYKSKAAPKDHPEYLIAKRAHRLILNLIDVDDVNYVSPIIIDAALNFIKENLNTGKIVLLHCNQGKSRSASIALLFMARKDKFHGKSLLEAEAEFKEIYTNYFPSNGMREYLRINWLKYNIK